MRTEYVGLAASVLLTLCVPVQARKYISYTNTSCANWTAARAKERNELDSYSAGYVVWGMQQWALGAVSGANEVGTGKDYLQKIDADAIRDWLDQRCSREPLMNFPEAVFELVKELQSR